MSNQVERILIALEASPKIHESENVSKHQFDLFSPSREQKMESEKDSRNSILQSGLEYPTKVDEVVNICNDDVCAEQNFILGD